MSVPMSTVHSPFTADGRPRFCVPTGVAVAGFAPAVKMSSRYVTVEWSGDGENTARFGRVVAALTTIDRAADVVLAPALSRATAVSEYEPAGTFVHVTLYGLVVSEPTSVEPA
jgi:hypothetical protein